MAKALKKVQILEITGFVLCLNQKKVTKFSENKAKDDDIKLIFGKPYHPQGRGKIEAYHKVLYRELISLKKFRSLSHFFSAIAITRGFDGRAG